MAILITILVDLQPSRNSQHLQSFTLSGRRSTPGGFKAREDETRSIGQGLG